MYKVDFLLSYIDSDQKERKIVMEYDGFYEHFKDSNLVNEFNYENYLTDGDVYRQKVLESYGYKFLRINKFNIGKDPIGKLNERLQLLIKPEPRNNPLMFKIHETIENLQSGDMKECPKCKEVRKLEDFKDSALSSGMGRFCKICKGIKFSTLTKSNSSKLYSSSCPVCGARMVRRTGRYGSFMGCSRYPYCKGTK
jgi:ssDNA-binding Zn-finger/Zn-ribbon topoisomerase 1